MRGMVRQLATSIRQPMLRPRLGVILPVVLFILLLIGLLAAGFSFRVHADAAANQASIHRAQTRLAAEAGVEWVKVMLAYSRLDTARWYHNPDELHRVIAWSADSEPSLWGTNEEIKGGATYRFSIVADDPGDDERFIRIGITDESSKLNLNTATEEQLLKMVTEAVADDSSAIPEEIVDAIIDWRDEDDKPNGEAVDTEGEYYRQLEKPYRVKNGPFDTVEELLLVKGVTGRVLYGEDFDRNGLLTPNEDDGEYAFPPDNQDNILNRGLYPYLTVLSAELEKSNANRERVYLPGAEAAVRAELETIFPGDTAKIDFIVAATRPPQQGGGGGGGGQGGGEQSGGRGGGQGSGGQGGKGGKKSDGVVQPNADGADGGGQGLVPIGGQPPGGEGTEVPNQKNAGLIRGRSSIDIRAQQPPGGDEQPQPAPEREEGQPVQPGGQDQQPPNGQGGEPEGDQGQPQGGEQGQGGDGQGSEQGGDGAGEPVEPIKTPAQLLLPQKVGDNQTPSPLTTQDLATLMDRTTVNRPGEKGTPGLININTAPTQVLSCLPELTAEQIREIVEMRETLDAETRATTAWLVTQEVLDLPTFIKVAPHITARGQQFTIESLGYADHLGMITRLQVVVDMLGPIAQPILYRDLTALGASYPIREEDRENVRGR